MFEDIQHYISEVRALDRKVLASLFELLISFIGIILSSYLWWVHLNEPESLLCTTGGCGSTLTGESSLIFGVPIAFTGLIFYLFVFIFNFQRIFDKSWYVEYLYRFVLLNGVIFTIYLRYLEFEKIGAICTWCWVSVLLVMSLCFSYFWNLSRK